MLTLSKTHFDPDLPFWKDYLPFLKPLAGDDFPGCGQLNTLLPPGLVTHSGRDIRFVPSHELPDEAYETRIFTSGRVSTRPENWHDLFNAMVWLRFPHIKIAMNALHVQAWSDQQDGTRGDLRDALTLFDECGVIVFSDDRNILDALTRRCWQEAFLNENFDRMVELSICGHAILEKYLSPYKSMTAKALLLHVSTEFMRLPRQQKLTFLDRQCARRMIAGTLLKTPACLSPLPLAGVPGWWPVDEQGEQAFYEDLQVFRPAPASLVPAQVVSMENGVD